MVITRLMMRYRVLPSEEADPVDGSSPSGRRGYSQIQKLLLPTKVMMLKIPFGAD
ncbi:hypothetical protein OK016_01225 [Vibrio chagasii]|nr:hypothetical protein [Vibrio chagasii]